jgi:hypothetical protein
MITEEKSPIRILFFRDHGQSGLSVPKVMLGGMSNDIPLGLGDVARFQAGVVSRRQALRSGMSHSAIASKVKFRRWRQIYPGVYAAFSGPVGRDAQLWAAVLYAGKGAQLSHETAAEVNGLADRQSQLIHVTVPTSRRVKQPPGMVIHRSAYLDVKARFPRGVVPHTLVEETVIELVGAASSFDEACGWVTAAFGRRLTGEGPLRSTLSARRKLRWRGPLDEMITAAAGGAHSLLEFLMRPGRRARAPAAHSQ